MEDVGKTVVFDIEHDKETVQFSTLPKICSVLNIMIGLGSPLIEEYREGRSDEKS
jgi:HTH-type transcriptional regulator/antitoxin HipB